MATPSRSKPATVKIPADEVSDAGHADPNVLVRSWTTPRVDISDKRLSWRGIDRFVSRIHKLHMPCTTEHDGLEVL